MGGSQDEAAALEQDINGYVVMSIAAKANGIQLRCEMWVSCAQFCPFMVNPTHHMLSKEECQGVIHVPLIE